MEPELGKVVGYVPYNFYDFDGEAAKVKKEKNKFSYSVRAFFIKERATLVGDILRYFLRKNRSNDLLITF